MKNNVGTALKVSAAYIIGAAFSAFNVWAIARLCGSASVVFYSLGGAVALLSFFALTHETGHLTAAKIAGFKTVKFSCLCFRYDKREKKKFSFDFSCKNFGETTFVPRGVGKEDGDNARKFINVALGGTVASALKKAVKPDLRAAKNNFRRNIYRPLPHNSFRFLKGRVY